MDFHGAELRRTWTKLGATAAEAEAPRSSSPSTVPGWRAGDRVIVTATSYRTGADEGDVPSVAVQHETEERTIRSIDGAKLELDAPAGIRAHRP